MQILPNCKTHHILPCALWFCSHFIKAASRKLTLEKTCFQRGFELSKNISFVKKKVEHQKLKKYIKFKKYGIWELHSGTSFLNPFGCLDNCPRRQMPHRHLPPDNCPLKDCSLDGCPEIIDPWTTAPEDNCIWENFPPGHIIPDNCSRQIALKIIGLEGNCYS